MICIVIFFNKSMFFTVVEIIICAFVKDYIYWITISKNLPQTEWIKRILVTWNLQKTFKRLMGLVFWVKCFALATLHIYFIIILQQFDVNFMSVVNFTEKAVVHKFPVKKKKNNVASKKNS